MTTGLLILRVVVGALFVGHGTQKLIGWFGGHGIDRTAGFLESLRYMNSRMAAVVAGLTETVSGLLLALGFLTPLAVAGIIGVMLNAVVSAHLPKGLWNANGGFELPLVYSVVAAAIGFTGPGTVSLDHLLGLEWAGGAYGVGAIVLGLVAGLTALANRRPDQASRPEAVPTHTERVAA